MKQRTLDLLDNLLTKIKIEDLNLFVGPAPHGEGLYLERDEIIAFLSDKAGKPFIFDEISNIVKAK